MFINDIFFFIEKTQTVNYAEDNTQYATDKTLDGLFKFLEKETSIVLYWFRINESQC